MRNRKYKSTQNSQSDKPLSTRLSATLSKAIALHQEGQFSVAKKLYEEVLAKSPKSFDALHLLGVLEYQSNRPERAAQLIGNALEIRQDRAEVYTNHGVALKANQLPELALQSYDKAIAIDPHYAEAHFNKGNALKELGKHEEAINSYDAVIAIRPDHAGAHNNRGACLDKLGQNEAAAKSFHTAISIDPRHAPAHCNLGNMLINLSQYETALRSYDVAISIDPNYAQAHCNHGVALNGLWKHEAAMASFNKAIALKPDYADAYNNRAVALNELRQHQTAVDSCDQAIRIQPDHADAHYTRGVALNYLWRYQEAAASYEKAIAIKPDYIDAYNNRGIALFSGGEIEASKRCFHEVLSRWPDNAKARLHLANADLSDLPYSSADAANVLDCFEEAVDDLAVWSNAGNLPALGEVIGENGPFYLAYLPGNHCRLLSRYGDLVADAAAASTGVRGTVQNSLRSKPSRLRLGIVCEHVRRHSVWDIILKGLIAYLDPSLFEVFLYHPVNLVDDEVAFARSRVASYIPGPYSTEGWIQRIQTDAPDAIFFPEIGMNALIRKLSAIRLAPLQIASWGHPITSALPQIDVFLSGELIENSLTAQTHYRERLVCLPGTGACTLPLEIVAEEFDEQKFGFAVNRQQVNFVIPQMPFKFDPNDDHLLVQIAQQTGPCQFWIFDFKKMPWASNLLFRRLAVIFSDHGLDPDAYLKMIPTLSRERFFGFLDVMDVYLDCPNFSGYTTAWQAAKRGIPIVTLEGEFMRQRLAAGLLRKMGVTDTIASNAKEYVAIAISLGQESRDPLSRSTRRARVCDAAHAADEDVRVVRAFEKTLLEELAKQGVRIDNDNRPPAVQATQINQKMLPENPPLTKAPAPEPVVYPWQLLSSGLHLQTLKPDYAPVGLLEMITTPTRPATSGSPNLRVLDVGCFCGGSGRWLLKKFPGADIIGIEMLEKAAALAASDYRRVIVNTFENVDFESEGLVPGCLDVIIAADVLEHLYNPWAALQRLKPLLAPGGSIYVSLPNIRNLNILLGLAKGEWQYAGAGILDISHIRFFTRRQAIEMLVQTGWSVAEVRINPDARLTPVFAGKDLSQIQNIDAGHLKLEKLEKDDLLELMALQFFIHATPATDKGAQ